LRITLEISSEKEIKLPIHYNHILQGFLYKNLSNKDYREFLHQKGYSLGNKSFKLFTFSRLLGEFRIVPQKKEIIFTPPVKIIVAAGVEQFITDLAETLIKSELNFLGNQPVEVKSIGVHKNFTPSNLLQIKMLSPMVAYSTLTEREKKWTEYYSPWQPRFAELVKANLEAKYQVLYGEIPSQEELKIIPHGSQEQKFKSVIKYKGTVIVGYLGLYWLKGNPDLIKIAYDTGLGSKNAQGFGCWEVVG
jgi:CRISPR-associated endoribonuclease Cas6